MMLARLAHSSKLKRASLGIFFFFVCAVFIHVHSLMPTVGLDPSWVFSLNQVFAHKLTLGSDILFTFGPYASVYTGAYGPASDLIMIFGGLCFAIGYCVLFFLAAREATWPRIMLLSALLIFMTSIPDALYSSYALLVIGALVSVLSLRGWRFYFLGLIPFSLLPLIKFSFLPLFLFTIFTSLILLLWRRAYFASLAMAIVPLSALLSFWCLTPYSLHVLPTYILGSMPLAKGYSEAMALGGSKFEIKLYLVSVVFIITSAFSAKDRKSSLLFASVCALFLFFAFKHGFVRHDGHAMTAGSALILTSIIGSFLFAPDRMNLRLLISVIGGVIIIHHYETYDLRKFSNLATDLVGGSATRLFEPSALEKNFERALADIRGAHPLPNVKGTSDLYSFEQSVLFASNLNWNPRPVFQSYSAYTPDTITKNVEHLRNQNAPDNLFFKVQTIDYRFPSLDDGASWPAIRDNYKFINEASGFLHLIRNAKIRPESHFEHLLEEEHALGETIKVPESPHPIFIKIKIEPSLLGKVYLSLFKISQIELNVHLDSGKDETYRFISQMSATGFFLSPLVKDTGDFRAFVTNRLDALPKVEHFSLTVSSQPWLWNSHFQLSLDQYLDD